MNGYEFWSSIIHSIAWPITIVAGAFILRKGLTNFLTGLSKLRYKGYGLEVEAEARIDIDVVEARRAELQEIRALPPTSDSNSAADTAHNENTGGGYITDESMPSSGALQTSWLIRMAQANPRSAIDEAWRRIEQRLNDMYAEHVLATGSSDGSYRSFPVRLEFLSAAGRLYPPFVPLLVDMRNIRHRAVYQVDYEVTPEDAERFIEQAFSIIDEMERFRRASYENARSMNDKAPATETAPPAPVPSSPRSTSAS